MKRVVGIGGIFFKCKDVEITKAWYNKYLGIESDQYGGCFEWHNADGTKGHTVWSTFRNDTTYFDPAQQEFMINYRVYDLESLLVLLKEEGVVQIGEIDIQEYGKFAWILDPDGKKIELWQPSVDFEKYCTTVQQME
jgi:predicted enzyme related to lactoylglutathione lyase